MEHILPPVVYFAGEKGVGKDFACDTLVRERGYTKLHIAQAWVCREFGVRLEDYEAFKVENRQLIQDRGTAVRAENPNVLIDELDATLDRMLDVGHRVAVTGVRFRNEANYGITMGHLVVKVHLSRSQRRQRLLERGDSLALLDDPFEREVAAEDFPCHFVVPGDLEPTTITFYLEQRFLSLRTTLEGLMEVL